jgi:predicted dithiol-disulfide oxidoreductase (DUF899 family)
VSSSLIDKIKDCERRIHGLRTELARLRSKVPRTPVQKDYWFTNSIGQQVSFAELFGPHQELYLVHNMGESCPYSTLWADSFNGLLPHLESRAAFAVVSDDSWAVQRDFAASRGWSFAMYSSSGSSFKDDLGLHDDGLSIPGASTFYKSPSGEIFHCNDTPFGPGDPFCAVWWMIDMLPEGENNWRPRIRYDQPSGAA